MKTLYIERSTGECRSGDWVEKLELDGVERIVVGTGPGSFAGIRSALAFAQGYALGRPCEVLGLPSPCAIAAEIVDAATQAVAVVGDARRGKYWIALFDGFALTRDVFQVEREGLAAAVPADAVVVSPDAQRIDAVLKETFGERYRGERLPTEAGLRKFAEANPAILRPQPLPIYLNPAVRD